MFETVREVEADEINDHTIAKLEYSLEEYGSSTDKISIGLNSTKNISLEDLKKLPDNEKLYIRIVSAFNDERIDTNRKGDNYLHYYDNFYTKDEMRKIITTLENIESGMQEGWSEEQKLLYFINVIQNKIIYHPNPDKAPSEEIRTLRGLYTKKTVCVGFALILKELCDRNDIECHYVEGATTEKDYYRGYQTHAWNVVKLNGEYFPLDLTFNAGQYQSGKLNSIGDLFNVQNFIKNHYPGKVEKVQNYKENLKSIDGNFIHNLNKEISKNLQYENLVFEVNKYNGKKYRLTQQGYNIVNGKEVYRYLYSDLNEEGKIEGDSLILYSATSVADFVKKKLIKTHLEEKSFNSYPHYPLKHRLKKVLRNQDQLLYLRSINKEYSSSIFSILFSEENIQEALKRGDNFLGEVILTMFRQKPKRIIIDQNLATYLPKSKTKTFTRQDGSNFILKENHEENNLKVNTYNMYEYVKLNEDDVLKSNIIYSEKDLLLENNPRVINELLSRTHVDQRLKTKKGYLGSYNHEGEIVYDLDDHQYFNHHEVINLKDEDIKDYYQKISFIDLNIVGDNYEMIYDDVGQPKIVDRTTKEEATNKTVINSAMLANIWLTANNDNFKGKNAIKAIGDRMFNETKKQLFESFSNRVKNDLFIKGYIDTLSIYEELVEIYSLGTGVSEIIANIFKNEQTTNMIEEVYRNFHPNAKTTNIKSEPLYNKYHANKLLEQRAALETEADLLQVKPTIKGIVVEPYVPKSGKRR